jgi:hypothetical protein
MNEIFPDLASVLEQLIKEAESPDGVTGDCARAAYKAETVTRAQLSALERILRETAQRRNHASRFRASHFAAANEVI